MDLVGSHSVEIENKTLNCSDEVKHQYHQYFSYHYTYDGSANFGSIFILYIQWQDKACALDLVNRLKGIFKF